MHFLLHRVTKQKYFLVAAVVLVFGLGICVYRYYFDTQVGQVPTVGSMPDVQYGSAGEVVSEENVPTEVPTVAIGPATPLGQILLTYDNEKIVFSGLAVGTMFFEGSFPVQLADKNGLIVASGIAQADGEWMTTSSVPFTAVLQSEQPISAPLTGVLILKRDNPSGLPEHDITVTFPAILENK